MTRSIYHHLARATAGITLLSFSAFLAEPARAGIFAAPFSDFYSSQSLGPIALDSGGNVYCGNSAR